MGGLDIGRKTEKHMAERAGWGRFAPHLAVAEGGNARNACVEDAAPAAPGVDAEAFASLPAKLDFAERQSMAIEEFRHLVCRSQGFLLGAALIDRLGAQCPNALNDPGKILVARVGARAGGYQKQASQ